MQEDLCKQLMQMVQYKQLIHCNSFGRIVKIGWLPQAQLTRVENKQLVQLRQREALVWLKRRRQRGRGLQSENLIIE